MVRPRKSEHTKLRLLAAGVQILTLHGYHGTGIQKVLNSVGVPKGSFYNFFASKEVYVADIIYYYGEQIIQEFNSSVAKLEGENAVVVLWCSFRNKVRAKVAAGESCACLLGAMSAEIGQASSLSGMAIKAVESQWVLTIKELIQHAQNQGDIRTDIAALELAQIFYNCWQGNLLQYQTTNDPKLLLTQLHTFIKTLLTTDGQRTIATSVAYKEELFDEE